MLTKEEMMSLVSENLRISKNNVRYQMDKLAVKTLKHYDGLLLAGDVE